jgi:cobalamin biosynthesis Mg chelatase CobN
MCQDIQVRTALPTGHNVVIADPDRLPSAHAKHAAPRFLMHYEF